VTGAVRSDGATRVDDPPEASALYARGFYGTPDGTALELMPFEAAYLAESGRLLVADADSGRALDWSDLFRRASRGAAGFGVRYLVYRDLRQRGYVVRASPPPATFAVLPRGGVLHKTPARYWVEPLSEREPFDLARLRELARRALASKKTLLLGVVDEESDLTYYRVRRSVPTGSLPALPEGPPFPGFLTEDRVLVFDPDAGEWLARGRAFGSHVGSRVELSLVEAAYLAERGRLGLRDARSRRGVTLERLRRKARRLDPEFEARLAAYRWLRDRHLVVKTGFKYGSDFRAYPRNPEHAHARYLVHAVPETFTAAWPEIAGAVRVAQGVRKDLLIAAVRPPDEVDFLSLERVRP
jgi:tRNA-intron endonuclease